MRKRRTTKAGKGRPGRCIVVTIGGKRRRVCFDSKGRVKSNRLLRKGRK